MSLKAFLMEVAQGLKRDEKFVDSVMALLAQPGWVKCLFCVMNHSGVAFFVAGIEITEAEHMRSVDFMKLQFQGAVSGGKMGFMQEAFLQAAAAVKASAPQEVCIVKLRL